MSKIGVFVCHCGENISATVDCAKVAETAGNYDGVLSALIISTCVPIPDKVL